MGGDRSVPNRRASSPEENELSGQKGTIRVTGRDASTEGYRKSAAMTTSEMREASGISGESTGREEAYEEMANPA